MILMMIIIIIIIIIVIIVGLFSVNRGVKVVVGLSDYYAYEG